jgi:hypothetical protein
MEPGMIRRMNQIINGLLVLLLLSVLSGCSTVDEIEAQDLVGVWVEDRENCETDLAGCSWIEFMEDGHFTAENLPYDYFGFFPISSDAVFDASGTWEIELSSEPAGYHKVRIRFDANPEMDLPIYNDTLYVEGEIGDFILYAWHGDPDNRIDFTKLSDEH